MARGRTGDKRATMHHGRHDDGQAESPMMAEMEQRAAPPREGRILWTYWANIVFGVWLLWSPATLGLSGKDAANELACGAALIVLGAAALFPHADFWARWGLCLVGIWLLLAPLALWTDSPASFAQDTLIGALVIACSVLIPMMPGKAHHMAMMQEGPTLPPGWSYNPSSWVQRGPVIGLAVVSFFIAHYMAAFQLGHIESVWDPFFGDGTRNVLTSNVSMAWPISDAGLGSVSYMLEALSGFMGNQRRWRTMPWMVLMFGILVIPLGATSIILVILQPVMVGDWCTPCLITAALMLAMIPLAIDEVAAMLHFMREARREKQDLKRAFWIGGTLQADDRSGPTDETNEVPGARWPRAMLRGVTAPWNLVAATAAGLWLMAAPDVLASEGAAADVDRIVGALIVTVSVVAFAEVVRAARFVNLALAPLLFLGIVLGGGTTASVVNEVGCALVVALLMMPRGAVKQSYGFMTRYIA